MNPEALEQFSQEQSVWQRLGHTPGFIWRGGGWSAEDKATVVSVWEDADSHADFDQRSRKSMARLRGKRAHTRVQTFGWDVLREIRGRAPNFRLGLARAKYVRLVLVQLREDRVPHFVSQHASVWEPDLAAADGLWCGFFAEGEANWYLTFTAWRDAQAHAAATAELLPGLVERSGARGDCLDGRTYHMAIESRWGARG